MVQAGFHELQVKTLIPVIKVSLCSLHHWSNADICCLHWFLKVVHMNQFSVSYGISYEYY